MKFICGQVEFFPFLLPAGEVGHSWASQWAHALTPQSSSNIDILLQVCLLKCHMALPRVIWVCLLSLAREWNQHARNNNQLITLSWGEWSSPSKAGMEHWNTVSISSVFIKSWNYQKHIFKIMGSELSKSRYILTELSYCVTTEGGC